jgi:hypothetical protein
MRQFERPGIPIFFKLWFAFVALIAISIMGATVYAGVSVLQAGPEGIGKAIGSVIKGIDEGRK